MMEIRLTELKLLIMSLSPCDTDNNDGSSCLIVKDEMQLSLYLYKL